MTNALVVIILRCVAWLLVSWGIASTDFAMFLTNDPDTVQAVSAIVAAAVVMVSEEFTKRFGAAPTRLFLNVLGRCLQRISDKMVSTPTADTPQDDHTQTR